jgi:hypothetical protein
MDELQEALHKFERESDILIRIGERMGDVLEPHELSIALSQAKRARVACTILVKALARERDTLQP